MPPQVMFVNTCPAVAECIFRNDCCCCSGACRHCLNETYANDDERPFMGFSFHINRNTSISLTKSFHYRVGVQHSPLDPLHCVLTLHHRDGRHCGIVLHQAARCPRLQRNKSLRDKQSFFKHILKCDKKATLGMVERESKNNFKTIVIKICDRKECMRCLCQSNYCRYRHTTFCGMVNLGCLDYSMYDELQ